MDPLIIVSWKSIKNDADDNVYIAIKLFILKFVNSSV